MQPNRFVIAALLIFVPIAIVMAAGSADRTPEPAISSEVQGAWRNPSHGAINCLYCLLRIYGSHVDYADCINATRRGGLPQSVAEVGSLSRRLGVDLEARSLLPDELASIELPVLVHFEGDNPSAGYFGVLLQRQRQRVIFFNGSSATVATMDNETFFRRWSGVALLPAPSNAERLVPLSCGFLCALGALAVWRRIGHVRVTEVNDR